MVTFLVDILHLVSPEINLNKNISTRRIPGAFSIYTINCLSNSTKFVLVQINSRQGLIKRLIYQTILRQDCTFMIELAAYQRCNSEVHIVKDV